MPLKIQPSMPTYQRTSFSYEPIPRKTPSAWKNSISDPSLASSGQHTSTGVITGVSCIGGIVAATVVIALIWFLRKCHISSCQSNRQEDDIAKQKNTSKGALDKSAYTFEEYILAEGEGSKSHAWTAKPERTKALRALGSGSPESDHFSGCLPLEAICDAFSEPSSSGLRPSSISSTQKSHSFTITNPDTQNGELVHKTLSHPSGSLIQLSQLSLPFVAPSNPCRAYRTPARCSLTSSNTCPIYTPSQYGEPPSSIRGPRFTSTRPPPSLPQNYSTISLGSTADMYIGWDRFWGCTEILDMQLRQKEQTQTGSN